MATQSPVIFNAPQADVSTLLHDLAKRHITINYTLIAVLILVIAVGGFFGYRALVGFDKQVAALKVETAAAKTELATNKADRTVTTQQQAAQVIVIHDRDTKANTAIAAATAPKAVPQVVEDSKNYLGVVPQITPDNLLAYQPVAVQTFVATKIDRDRLSADYADLTSNYIKEQSKTASLTSDLDKETGLAEKWEAVTHKTKWARIWGGVKTGLILGGTAFASYEVGKHLGNKP